jgi:hypothetical protein
MRFLNAWMCAKTSGRYEDFHRTCAGMEPIAALMQDRLKSQIGNPRICKSFENIATWHDACTSRGQAFATSPNLREPISVPREFESRPIPKFSAVKCLPESSNGRRESTPIEPRRPNPGAFVAGASCPERLRRVTPPVVVCASLPPKNSRPVQQCPGRLSRRADALPSINGNSLRWARGCSQRSWAR